MFGESDSESPRVGSPWDSFITRSPSPSSSAQLEVKKHLGEGLPKLVPEVEYGNVEYKLKLLNPSPERFTRLVTQMKWRLLEGGGQAYYELGVADSGQLVGLPRKDLEQSLETLEMMAGDIGASVIVVKEIEVPAALVGRAMNSALGIPQRTPVRAITEGETEANTTTETETSATEDDDDALAEAGLDTPPIDSQAHPIAYRQTHFTTSIRSHPERPAFQPSPAIRPALQDALELDADSMFDFEIGIASVYKPRPHRARPVPITQTKYTKRGTVPKPKKPQLQHVRDANLDPTARAAERRMKRDARRDQRRRALLAPDIGELIVQDLRKEDAVKTTTELRDLHVGLDSTPPVVGSEPIIVPLLADITLRDVDGGGGTDADESTVIANALEPRLIVEALVVRKLALEEAFLDFGGFALEI